MGDAHPRAGEEVGVAQGEGGGVVVPLVVRGQLQCLPLGLLYLRHHLTPGQHTVINLHHHHHHHVLPCSLSGGVYDVGLEIARRINVSQDDWVGFLRREDVCRPDIGGTKSVSTGHDIGHCQGVIDLQGKQLENIIKKNYGDSLEKCWIMPSE